MAVPVLITELSTTASSNSPAGGDSAATADDFFRAHAAFIAQLYADKAPLTIPSVATGATTAALTHKGDCLAATGNITIPASIFAAGDVFSVYNNSASAITLIQDTGLTLRLAGTTTTGTRTLAPRGMSTVWFVSATEAVASGAGVS